LQQQILQIGREAGVKRLAVALYDYETETALSYRGDNWFHAASTIKVAVLVSVFGAIEVGSLFPHSRVHVRNRFLSVVDGEPYRIPPYGDTDIDVYAAIGRTMRVKDLAYYMIAVSSNIATNLLIDLVGLDRAQQTLEKLKLDGIELKRGVEDNKAFAVNINNRVTANGLLRLYRLLEDKQIFSPESSEQMLDILHQQKFNNGIPAGYSGRPAQWSPRQCPRGSQDRRDLHHCARCRYSLSRRAKALCDRDTERVES
jgi:beta-lactamase class A